MSDIFLRLEFQYGLILSVPQLEGVCGGVRSPLRLCRGGLNVHAREPKVLLGGKECVKLGGEIQRKCIIHYSFGCVRNKSNLQIENGQNPFQMRVAALLLTACF